MKSGMAQGLGVACGSLVGFDTKWTPVGILLLLPAKQIPTSRSISKVEEILMTQSDYEWPVRKPLALKNSIHVPFFYFLKALDLYISQN